MYAGTRYAVSRALSDLRTAGGAFSSRNLLSEAVAGLTGLSSRTCRRAFDEIDVTDLVHADLPGVGQVVQHLGQVDHRSCPTPAQPTYGPFDDPPPTPTSSLDSPPPPRSDRVMRTRLFTRCSCCEVDVEPGDGFIALPYPVGGCRPLCGSCWSSIGAFESQFASVA